MHENRYHTRCPLSGSEDLRPLKGYEKFHLVKSYPLGFVFSSKIPTETELVNFYNSYSREDYLSPITVIRFHELLDQFERFSENRRILDIGCGIGLFLEEAKKRGWQVYGTEYTDKAISICRNKGITMFQGKLDKDWFNGIQFDVITSFEVLEHINNPVEEMTTISRLLKEGGLFYFTTPNFNALERYQLKAGYSKVICYPEHLCYYTKKTADYLMKKAGLKKHRLLTTGFAVSGMLNEEKAGHSVPSPVSREEKIRTRFESNPFLKFIKGLINAFVNFFGVGVSIKGWYIKTA